MIDGKTIAGDKVLRLLKAWARDIIWILGPGGGGGEEGVEVSISGMTLKFGLG